MLTIEKKIIFERDFFDLLSKDVIKERIVIVDIETTGLSADYNSVFLIGILYFKLDSYFYKQLLVEKDLDEYELLFSINKLVNNYDLIINYNGNSFDIPFLEKRMKKYGINSHFANISTLDIYKSMKKYKHLLNASNLKLQTIEKIFGYKRIDNSLQKEQWKIYNKYIIEGDIESKEIILLHNYDDLIGLYNLLSIIELEEKLNKFIIKEQIFTNFSFERTTDSLKIEFYNFFRFPFKSLLGIYEIVFNSEKISISIPIFTGELKYYFENVKDYYYLKNEEIVVHKSVGKYVEKEYREKATRENCYIKKRGIFIPLDFEINSDIILYQESYSSSLKYIELNENYEASFYEKLATNILRNQLKTS